MNRTTPIRWGGAMPQESEAVGMNLLRKMLDHALLRKLLEPHLKILKTLEWPQSLFLCCLRSSRVITPQDAQFSTSPSGPCPTIFCKQCYFNIHPTIETSSCTFATTATQQHGAINCRVCKSSLMNMKNNTDSCFRPVNLPAHPPTDPWVYSIFRHNVSPNRAF